MFKPFLFTLSALSFCYAQSASAAEHTIYIEEGAFYPEITYLVPGDTVTFINNNSSSVEAIASDESWITSQLGGAESYILSVSLETALTFALASDSENAGSLSFDLAPLGDVDGNGAYDGNDAEQEASN